MNFMAELRADIKAAADRNASKLGSGKEIRTLVDELGEGETVDRIVTGFYGKGNGILVLTDRRLFFYLRGVVSSHTEDFPLSRISSIDFSGGLLMGKITVHVSGNKATIEQVQKDIGKELVDNVRERISRPVQAVPTPAATAPVQESAADQLLKLKSLLDAGILSQAQYDEKAAPLIAQL
ncbi:hypothetical protein ASQ49_02695 [Acidipropionibacterium acidipropionici]|nr:hypothetical protein ASQ49_02695 [Acidipropionibacterium acidipropionici]